MCVCVSVCVYICVCVYIYMRVYVCVCVCVCVYIYVCVCIYIYKNVYLGSKLLFKEDLLMTMKDCLLFLILFFRDSLLFFYCQDLDCKGIVSYLQPKRF